MCFISWNSALFAVEIFIWLVLVLIMHLQRKWEFCAEYKVFRAAINPLWSCAFAHAWQLFQLDTICGFLNSMKPYHLLVQMCHKRLFILTTAIIRQMHWMHVNWFYNEHFMKMLPCFEQAATMQTELSTGKCAILPQYRSENLNENALQVSPEVRCYKCARNFYVFHWVLLACFLTGANLLQCRQHKTTKGCPFLSSFLSSGLQNPSWVC